MYNWQNILVALIVLAAVVYVARRALTRLRTFRSGRAGAPCDTGCGSCGDDRKPTATPKTIFVEIGRSRRATRRNTH